MVFNRASPLLLIVSTMSRCSALRSVLSSSLVIPLMPNMGVRISWLIMARISDFLPAVSNA